MENTNGTFTEPTCNNSCGIVPPVQKYSCNNNSQCVADSNGQYTSNDCDNKCVSVPVPLSITTTSLSDATEKECDEGVECEGQSVRTRSCLFAKQLKSLPTSISNLYCFWL